MNELLATIVLSRMPLLGTIGKRRIVENFESLAPLLKGKSTLTYEGKTYPVPSAESMREAEREIEKLSRMGVSVITLKDPAYPSLLRAIPDAPVVLFKKGPLDFTHNSIAVIGSRKATFEGLNLAGKIGQTLSSLGITVVSGLARGIDASAQNSALKEKGKTIAVLGSGIDICYPSENRNLFDRIGEEGLIVTEYGLGERPLRHHFPERNRIIAGLAKGVLVVEASRRSGSLITARLALEYGREVMSVPGNIFREEHEGANALIREGAKLIATIEDVLSGCFPNLEIKKEPRIEMQGNEEYIYSLIGHEKIHVDEVVEKSSLKTKDVMATLTVLEMKEAITQFPGGYYIRR